MSKMTPAQLQALQALASLDKDLKTLTWGPEADGEWETCCGRFTVLYVEPVDEWLEEDPAAGTPDLASDGRHVLTEEAYVLRWHEGKALGSYDTFEDAQRMAELALQLQERYPERFMVGRVAR